jgi:hypothetical protein
MMNLKDFGIMADKTAPRQDRIDIIKKLGIIRSQQKNEQLILATTLSEGVELAGQRELKRVIQRQRDHIDVRCTAVTVAAETDNATALDWCDETIRRHL